MKPIDYIYKNLGHLNMTVLEQIITDAGETVSEEIYDYLRETPWNTNPALLKQFGLDIERPSDESDDGWITIRLERQTVSIGGEETEVLGAFGAENVSNFLAIKNAWTNNQHPIITITGEVDVPVQSGVEHFSFNNQVGTVMEMEYAIDNFAVYGLDFNFEGLVFVCTEDDSKQYVCNMLQGTSGYIEIKYKFGDYYTGIVHIGNDTTRTFYVTPNFTWKISVPDDYHLEDADGNGYHNNATFTFTDNEEFTLKTMK